MFEAQVRMGYASFIAHALHCPRSGRRQQSEQGCRCRRFIVFVALVWSPVSSSSPSWLRPSTATSKLKLTTPDNLSCQRPRSGTLLEARALDHCAQIALNFQRDYSDTPDPGPYAFADHLPDTRLDRVTMLSRLLYLMLEFRISRGHPQPVL